MIILHLLKFASLDPWRRRNDCTYCIWKFILPWVAYEREKRLSLLIKNHGFNDGNKRVGCIVLLTLCYKNNIAVKPSQQDLINLGLGVASGVLDKNDIRNFILKNKI